MFITCNCVYVSVSTRTQCHSHSSRSTKTVMMTEVRVILMDELTCVRPPFTTLFSPKSAEREE